MIKHQELPRAHTHTQTKTHAHTNTHTHSQRHRHTHTHKVSCRFNDFELPNQKCSCAKSKKLAKHKFIPELKYHCQKKTQIQCDAQNIRKIHRNRRPR